MRTEKTQGGQKLKLGVRGFELSKCNHISSMNLRTTSGKNKSIQYFISSQPLQLHLCGVLPCTDTFVGYQRSGMYTITCEQYDLLYYHIELSIIHIIIKECSILNVFSRIPKTRATVNRDKFDIRGCISLIDLHAFGDWNTLSHEGLFLISEMLHTMICFKLKIYIGNLEFELRKSQS